MISTPPAGPPPEGCKRRILKRYEALKTERSAWVVVWKQLAEYILPRRFRDTPSLRNKPAPNEKLINNTPTQAARTLAAGLMGGLTSPARPWFRLGVPDIQTAQLGPVKEWLDKVENILREVLIRSNVYNGLASIFQDLGTFSTAAMTPFPVRNSSRILSKISTLESTAIPMVRITPAIPGSVRAACR